MIASMIPIAKIDAGDRLRVLDPTWVALLAEEIATDGLIEPIRVVERGEGFLLVAGARRLAAHVQLGWDEIEADIASESELADANAVRLAEIEADMLRGDLTALDRAVYIGAWCDIYRAASEPAKPGRKKASEPREEVTEEFSAKLALNWTEAAQNALQIGRRTIFRSLQIAGIDAEIRRAIALHPIADIQSELLLLAELTPTRQAAVIDVLLSEPVRANSVTDAIFVLDEVHRPKPLTALDKYVQRFVTLKPSDQERFFEMQRDAIERWQAKEAASRKPKLRVA